MPLYAQLRHHVSLGLAIVILAVLGVGAAELSQRLTPKADTPTINSQATTQFSQTGQDGKTVLEILRQDHKIETVDQGSLGVYITAIDGKAVGPDGFWIFYIDKKLGDMSVDKTYTTNTQTIEWRYEPF